MIEKHKQYVFPIREHRFFVQNRTYGKSCFQRKNDFI